MSQPESMQKLIAKFSRLPGVGGKMAQRFAYSIIEMDFEQVRDFAQTLVDAKNSVMLCPECFDYTDSAPCRICSTRKKETVMVVAYPKDVIALEKVRSYNGVYHVLHGTLNPLNNKGPGDIKIKELITRVTACDSGVKEVIIATNPDIEGEATAMYIVKLLKPFGIKVTRIAQGVSMGSDIEYADEVTLTRALEDRKPLN